MKKIVFIVSMLCGICDMCYSQQTSNPIAGHTTNTIEVFKDSMNLYPYRGMADSYHCNDPASYNFEYFQKNKIREWVFIIADHSFPVVLRGLKDVTLETWAYGKLQYFTVSNIQYEMLDLKIEKGVMIFYLK